MADRIARLLANPLRDRLMFEYEREPTSPSRIARRLDLSLNLVSYHTNVLLRGGCLRPAGTARRRGALEHFYESAVAAEIQDDEWEQMSPALRRALIMRAVGVASEEARRGALLGGFDGPRAHLSRMLLSLDDAALGEVSALLRETVERMRAIESAARERSPVTAVPQQELLILCFDRDGLAP
jgi:hypothetical protein